MALLAPFGFLATRAVSSAISVVLSHLPYYGSLSKLITRAWLIALWWWSYYFHLHKFYTHPLQNVQRGHLSLESSHSSGKPLFQRFLPPCFSLDCLFSTPATPTITLRLRLPTFFFFFAWNHCFLGSVSSSFIFVFLPHCWCLSFSHFRRKVKGDKRRLKAFPPRHPALLLPLRTLSVFWFCFFIHDLRLFPSF